MSLDDAAPVGIVGVGAMGSAVARRLLNLDRGVCVRDIRPEAEQPLSARGAVVCDTPAAVARGARALILLVVDAGQIEQVLFGADGAASELRPGDVVILSSTISPSDAQSFAGRLAGLGVHALDAPISGGPARAEAGTMSMMVAGAEPALEAAEPLLSLLSNAVFTVSHRPGDGARFKLLNNILAATQLAAGAEVMALGQKMGLDGNRLLEVIIRSSGASWVVADRMPRALAEDYEPRAATRILAKDVSLFMELARSEGFPAMVCSQTQQVFSAALANGLGDLDDAALLRLYQVIGGGAGQEP